MTSILLFFLKNTFKKWNFCRKIIKGRPSIVIWPIFTFIIMFRYLHLFFFFCALSNSSVLIQKICKVFNPSRVCSLTFNFQKGWNWKSFYRAFQVSTLASHMHNLSFKGKLHPRTKWYFPTNDNVSMNKIQFPLITITLVMIIGFKAL